VNNAQDKQLPELLRLQNRQVLGLVNNAQYKQLPELLRLQNRQVLGLVNNAQDKQLPELLRLQNKDKLDVGMIEQAVQSQEQHSGNLWNATHFNMILRKVMMAILNCVLDG
jgi:hypothetical protein